MYGQVASAAVCSGVMTTKMLYFLKSTGETGDIYENCILTET